MSKLDSLNSESVQDYVELHEDVSNALSALPEFGYNNQKNISDIDKAQDILNELNNLLQHYIHTRKNYESSFGKLLDMLDEAGISQCVDDLVAVRRNVRKKGNPSKKSFPANVSNF